MPRRGRSFVTFTQQAAVTGSCPQYGAAAMRDSVYQAMIAARKYKRVITCPGRTG